MRYVSDDGKKIGTQEEVLKYEQDLKTAEEAKKKAKADLDERWNKIQKIVSDLNDAVNKYIEDSGETLRINCSINDGVSIAKGKDTVYDGWLHDFFRI